MFALGFILYTGVIGMLGFAAGKGICQYNAKKKDQWKPLNKRARVL